MVDWGSVVEWVGLGVGIIFQVVFTGFLIWWILNVTRRSGDFMAGVFGSGTATMRDGRPTMRSLFCRHRYLARIRNAYGREYTACARCGLDLNRGKERHEWR